MIKPQAISEYLKRPLDSHLWVKKLSREELEQEIDGIDGLPVFHTKPNLHQLACFLLGVHYPQFLFLLDMGTGKTWVALNLLRYSRNLGTMKRALVFSPYEASIYSWEEEIKKHAPDLPYMALVGSSAEKWRAFDELEDGLVLCTYGGVVRMVSNRIKGPNRGRLQLDHSLLQRFCTGADALVLDESDWAGNHQSLTHQMVAYASKRIPVRYALSGRPFGRDPTPLFAQFKLIDHGLTFGQTLGMFREAFFHKKMNYWSGFPEYVFDNAKEPELNRMIQHRSIRYSVEECLDLPELARIRRTVTLASDIVPYYRRTVREIIAVKRNLRLTRNLFLRMRQLSSGFLGFIDDETAERAEVEFTRNPKLEALQDLVGSLPRGRQMVIFYEFTWSGRKICGMLKEMKINHGWLWSGTKNVQATLTDFTKGSTSVLVVQSAVGAYALNLQNANYLVFYESPVSVRVRDQAERRVHRAGQSHKVLLYDLVVKGTVDEKILEFHREGRDLFQALIDDPAMVVGPLVD